MPPRIASPLCRIAIERIEPGGEDAGDHVAFDRHRADRAGAEDVRIATWPPSCDQSRDRRRRRSSNSRFFRDEQRGDRAGADVRAGDVAADLLQGLDGDAPALPSSPMSPVRSPPVIVSDPSAGVMPSVAAAVRETSAPERSPFVTLTSPKRSAESRRSTRHPSPRPSRSDPRW